MKSRVFTTDNTKLTRLLKGNKTNLLLSVLMIGLAVSVLGYLVYSQREVLLSYDWQINSVPFFTSFGFDGIALLLGAWVWAEVMNTIGPPLPFGQHFQFFTMNILARRIPGTVWHVLYRVQAYNRFGIPVRLTTVATGIELVICIISGAITTAFFGLPILMGYDFGPWIFGVILFVGIFLLNPRLLMWVMAKFIHEPVVLKTKNIIGWVLLYTALWTVGGIILFQVINIIYPLPLSQLSYVIGCWVLVGTVTQVLLFLPSNFGVGEASLSLLLSQIMPSPIAVMVSVANRILLTFFEILWALAVFFLRKTR